MVVLGGGAVSYERGTPVGAGAGPSRDGPHIRQGYLAHKKRPPPQEHHRSLGIGLLKGPTGGVFVMSKVPLYVKVNNVDVGARPETVLALCRGTSLIGNTQHPRITIGP